MTSFYILVPLNILYDFLEKVCAFETNIFIFDTSSFKKVIYMNLYEPFVESLKEYMKPMKYLHYKTKSLNYMLVVSILKEICKQQKLTIKRNQRNYLIEYRE